MIMTVYSLYCPKTKGHKYESGTITELPKLNTKLFINPLCFLIHFYSPFLDAPLSNCLSLDMFFSKVNKR